MARTALDLLADDDRRTRMAAGSRAVERRSGGPDSDLLNPQNWFLDWAMGPKVSSGARVNQATAMTVPTVYACNRIISESLAMTPLGLYERTATGRDEVEVTSHPAAEMMLLDPVPERMTSFEWREMTQGHIGLRGNGYSRIKRTRHFEAYELDPRRPDEVSPVLTPDGRLFYRDWRTGEEVGASDMLHVRGLSDDGVIGYSPVRLLCETLGLSIAARKHLAESYGNGARFPGYLVTPGNMKPDDAAKIAEAWDKARVERGNKPPVLWGGLDWKSVGMNHQEAQILLSGQVDRKDILDAFRVPAVLSAHSEKAATYASVEQFAILFAQYTLQPSLTRWEERLNMQLLSRDDRLTRRLYFKFNLNALLRGDTKARAEFYKLMREIRAMTVNEVRALEDMNDFPDNIGDNPREDFNGQGGKSAKEATTKPTNQQEANA